MIICIIECNPRDGQNKVFYKLMIINLHLILLKKLFRNQHKPLQLLASFLYRYKLYNVSGISARVGCSPKYFNILFSNV